MLADKLPDLLCLVHGLSARGCDYPRRLWGLDDQEWKRVHSPAAVGKSAELAPQRGMRNTPGQLSSPSWSLSSSLTSLVRWCCLTKWTSCSRLVHLGRVTNQNLLGSVSPGGSSDSNQRRTDSQATRSKFGGRTPSRHSDLRRTFLIAAWKSARRRPIEAAARASSPFPGL